MRTAHNLTLFGAAPTALNYSISTRPVRLGIATDACGNTTHVENVDPYLEDIARPAGFEFPSIRTLLVPLDGSPFAERALPLAVKIARRSGAELRIVHVDLTFEHPHTCDRFPADICLYCAQQRLQKRIYMDRIARELRVEFSVRVKPLLLENRDVALALRDAVGSDVDLVVMAAHGKGLIRRWVSGSTLHELIRELSIPLLVVGADGSFLGPAPDRLQRILIALDGSPGAEQAIGPAIAIGDIAAAEYVLLRVVSPSTVFHALANSYRSGQFHDSSARAELATARQYMQRMTSRFERRSAKVDAHIVLDEKAIARSIASQAVAYDADMIAIASRKSEQRKRRWRGSIAERVVQFSSVPVLIASV